MKIFAFIMAVMVFAFSCIPCMDEAYALNYEAKTEIANSSNQQEHSATDACSPFCTCNCCAGFAFSIAYYQIGYLTMPSVEKNALHLPATISDISLPVWQPPQLS